MKIETAYEKTLSYNTITRKLHANKQDITLNQLKKYDPEKKLRVIDIGCGPCQIFPKLKSRFSNIEYLGIEPMSELYEAAKNNFSGTEGFSIQKALAQDVLKNIDKTDVILSFDSLEHIPLNFRHMVIDQISKIEFKDLFINVPNEVGPAILIKNYGSMLMRYVRHKEYTNMETWLAAFYRIDRFPKHIDQHKGFDWRGLYATLRFYFETDVYTSPSQLVPRCLSPSLFFHCQQRGK